MIARTSVSCSTVGVSVADVAAAVLARRRVKAQRLTICCDDVERVAGRDVLDSWLTISGVKEWEWRDAEGGVSLGAPSAASFLRVVRDLVAWPGIYARKRREVNSRGWSKVPEGRLGAGNTVLFLRTDHWFGVKSGGSVAHLNGVIHGLRDLGKDTQVFSSDVIPGIDLDENFHLCRPTYNMGRNIPNLTELLYNDELCSAISRTRYVTSPAFIYERYSLGNYVGALLKRTLGVPYVCEYNGSMLWVARHWESRKLFHEGLLTEVEMLNLRLADVIVVVSQALANELVERDIPREKVLVNPNGVDPAVYTPDLDGSRMRKRLGLEGKLVVGFVGTFRPWHGAELLGKAFGRLLAENPTLRDQVRLLMIGDGPTAGATKEALHATDALDQTAFLGSIPQAETPSYLAACDVLVTPQVPNPDGTPFFGSPTKLFEYMAMGKAIVASNLDQLGEVLEHDRTAWLVEPGDVSSLQYGLQQLVRDSFLRDRLGAAARTEVVARYTWREHTSRIIEMVWERCA